MAVSTEQELSIVLLNMFIFGVGATLDVIGMLLWSRRIPPNKCVGIRIKAMGNNRDVWFEVNQYAGKVITIEGLFLVCFGLLFMILPGSFSFLARLLTFTLVFLATLAGSIVVCLLRAKAFSSPFGQPTSHYDQL